jgi:alanine dehydrogenase
MAQVFFVSESAAESLSHWKEVIGWISDGYRQQYTATEVPRRTVSSSKDAWLRVLPAIPPGTRYFGAKLMGAALTGTAAVQYVVVLFDRTSSQIAGFVDGDYVTRRRTAATSAAALDCLTPGQPISLGVLGSGFEAASHVQAIAAIRPVRELFVYSPTATRRENFADRFRKELGVPCRAVSSSQEAVGTVDVVLAAARSRGEVPILFGEWLKPGSVVVSIGSTIPTQREIDISVVERCELIVCDSVDEVVHESGDMLEATRASIKLEHKVHSLSALIRGEIGKSRSAEGIAMFKSVGSGFQDVVVAGHILERAIASGLATELPIAFSKKQI